MNETTGQRRARILEAAETLLEHYGPLKTTIADIARRAGVAVGSVYLEFDSKNELVGVLSRQRHARVIEAMRSAATAAPDAPTALRAALHARTLALLAAAGCGEHGQDLIFCTGCTGVVEARRDFVAHEHALLRSLLAAGAEAGTLRPCADADATVAALLEAHVAFTPPLLFERCPDEEVLDALHDLLLDGLRPR